MNSKPADGRIELLKNLPQIEEVLNHPALQKLAERIPHHALADIARAEVDAWRKRLLDGSANTVDSDRIAQGAVLRAHALTQPSLRRVINATGVIVHTNLGRSPLAPEAVAAVNEVIGGYSTLEYDTTAMTRGSRHAHCEALICALTGAEAALAVNNNAAAVMMVLSEFAAEHEAIVSRGELIEIGGSFRIPDIMNLSHARMVEVGTTNKTHPADYERALTPNTAMLLKVHPSNYRLIGFTEQVDVARLRTIADAENKRRKAKQGTDTPNAMDPLSSTAQLSSDATSSNTQVLVYEDQGSGAFSYLAAFGSYAEPTVAKSIENGADLVSFSGDKLLGGPQAGIIVGNKQLIDRLKKNPLARALRLDKMTLAALEATLRLYLQPDEAPAKIPTLRMLTETADDVRPRAEALHKTLEAALDKECARITVVSEISRAGGGALPMCDIPTTAVEVNFLKGNAQDCQEHLVKNCPTPIITRISKEAVLCDARTILTNDEISEIAQGFTSYFKQL
ncbi:seryl-tRNA(Sec) selenium transferase [Cryptobacterium curtum DSM 15641]|uniref:L-seryl-tRNA(Sec) selenium transferase n=1 Tax=Cryptobacterium curtum (strain ATCC 700683 / DSM 15641 / CCUG 43107 / 12-3) TaxID=469378 RepID=C7MPI8_CRYCD|nr:L-seryl-tRNA(Sec) selenium transferase [Cryptobacterium curtum]ACU94828.1 seryl-tRNA(Sec) selenium transferase [Cryptobacterium curtum DSM 15641]